MITRSPFSTLEGVQHSGAEGDALLQLAVADAFLGSADGES
jgi:hypothetical protein